MYASLVELDIIPMNSIGIYLNGFTPNSTGQISNSTGHEIMVKMGVNSLRLHLYACLIELGIIPVISTQFEGGIKFYPPRSNSTGHEIMVKMGVNLLRLHLYACLIELGIIPVISTQFEGGIKFYPPQSNSTRHEILVKMGVNLLRLHCMPPWLNWVSSQ